MSFAAGVLFDACFAANPLPGVVVMAQQPQKQQQEMSFAKALNEAKGVLVQLSNRVQADAAKLRQQQQTIVSQSATIAEQHARIREQDEQIARYNEEVGALHGRTTQAEAAREHAEALVNRQGEK